MNKIILLSIVLLIIGIYYIYTALTNIIEQSVDYTYIHDCSSSLPTIEPNILTIATISTATNIYTTEPIPTVTNTPEHKTFISDNMINDGNIGNLYIPALNQKLPIVEDTEPEDLKKGVGHFKQSVMAGEKDNCILSGHRDTVFSKLGRLKIGDKLIVQTFNGVYTYRVRAIRIVEADDETVIVPSDKAILTLTTCYPFNFVGSAPKRYIVIADLLSSFIY